MEASAPRAAHIEPEPPGWQPRATWVGARLLCGSISFFFAAFVFAYFYLQALNVNHHWRIGPTHPSKGLGIAIVVLHFSAQPLGRAVALSLALATCIAWNFGLWLYGRYRVSSFSRP